MISVTKSLAEAAQATSLFAKYSATPRDDDSPSPKHSVPATQRYRVGDYWTVPVRVPLSELSGVKATAISKDRLKDLGRTRALPPVEIALWRSGSYELIDGNHRLVRARQEGNPDIEVRFTFPDP